MKLYALVSLETGRSVELYPTVEAATAALEDVRTDEPALADSLAVWALAFQQPLN